MIKYFRSCSGLNTEVKSNHQERDLSQISMGRPCGRMVKKPEHSFVAGVMRQSSSNLRLAHGALHAAYSTPVEGRTGRGCTNHVIIPVTNLGS
jgi:hypothetical protein